MDVNTTMKANPSAQRRQDERERRRGEIVDAADALARELGWNGVTVEGVARRARLSRALVYLYFRDKTDLHAALWERAAVDLHQRFSAAIAVARPDCMMEAIGRAYIRFAEEMPHYFEALIHFEGQDTGAGPDDGAATQALARQTDVHQLMVDVLRAGQEAGVVRPDCGDLGLTAVVLWSFTHGLIQISTAKRTHFERIGLGHEALLEQAFAMLRRTISPTG
jgi:AcrR family transcriptional regulator